MQFRSKEPGNKSLKNIILYSYNIIFYSYKDIFQFNFVLDREK